MIVRCCIHTLIMTIMTDNERPFQLKIVKSNKTTIIVNALWFYGNETRMACFAGTCLNLYSKFVVSSFLCNCVYNNFSINLTWTYQSLAKKLLSLQSYVKSFAGFLESYVHGLSYSSLSRQRNLKGVA